MSLSHLAVRADAVPPYIGPKPAEYARPTLITLCVLIGVAGIVQWSRLAIQRRRPRKVLAALRAVTYTRIPYLDLGLGSALMLFSITLAFLLYITIPGQIYRAPKLSPLGLRSGYVAIAMTPFVYTFGSRINPLAALTRVGHEKWMVYHQYGARIILFFSLLHGGLIIHSRYLIGGWAFVREYFASKGDASQFFGKAGVLVNGLLAASVMVWMIISSVFRHRSYEFFVIQHIISILLLTISLVAHLQVDLDEGINYVYACVAIWGTSLLYRAITTVWSTFGLGRWVGEAEQREMPEGVTELNVAVHKRHLSRPRWLGGGGPAWRAGQHVYLRLPGLNVTQSHPFTIASVSARKDASSTEESVPRLRLLIKTRSGLTAALAKRGVSSRVNVNAESGATRTRVILDGPYGCLSERLSGFDDVLLVAGGVGATFVFPLAEHLQALGKPYRVVWTVRNAACVEWFASSTVSKDRLRVHVSDPVYQATSQSSSQSSVSGGLGKENDSAQSDPSTTANADAVKSSADSEKGAGAPQGRLNMRDLAAQFVDAASTGSRVAILACGPSAMLGDLSKAVSSIQWKIARGDIDIAELWLHREGFSH